MLAAILHLGIVGSCSWRFCRARVSRPSSTRWACRWRGTRSPAGAAAVAGADHRGHADRPDRQPAAQASQGQAGARHHAAAADRAAAETAGRGAAGQDPAAAARASATSRTRNAWSQDAAKRPRTPSRCRRKSSASGRPNWMPQAAKQKQEKQKQLDELFAKMDAAAQQTKQLDSKAKQAKQQMEDLKNAQDNGAPDLPAAAQRQTGNDSQNTNFATSIWPPFRMRSRPTGCVRITCRTFRAKSYRAIAGRRRDERQGRSAAARTTKPARVRSKMRCCAAQPLPYKGFESVFSRNFNFHIQADNDPAHAHIPVRVCARPVAAGAAVLVAPTAAHNRSTSTSSAANAAAADRGGADSLPGLAARRRRPTWPTSSATISTARGQFRIAARERHGRAPDRRRGGQVSDLAPAQAGLPPRRPHQPMPAAAAARRIRTVRRRQAAAPAGAGDDRARRRPARRRAPDRRRGLRKDPRRARRVLDPHRLRHRRGPGQRQPATR